MLHKIGSHLKISKTAATAEDLLIERPMEEKSVGHKILEPKNDQFLYYRARAISAGDQGPLQRDGQRGWAYNGNYDYFPRKELESSYDTFRGRNIFLDHNSESSLYSIGKIIDAVPVDDPETGEFYIELVGKIDRTLHPEICRKIETGELNSTSMGCSVDDSMCSICGNVLHSDADEKCEHMGMNLGKKFPAEIDMPEYNIRKGEMVPCFSINKGIVFNEDSIVGVPADPTAVIKTVLSNMKNRLTKKASLSKEEQLDLAAQMEKLFEKLDETTKISLKAEFCGICPPVEKESVMSDKNVSPSEDQKKILAKISALEMEQLESYVKHKTKKANEVANKEVIADATSKEETFLSKIVAKVKNSFAAELLEKKIETVAKEEMGKKADQETGKCNDCGGPLEKGDDAFCAACSAREAFGSKKKLAETFAKPPVNLNDNSLRCPRCDGEAELSGKGENISCFHCGYEGPSKKSLSAKFNEDKKNVLASTWSVYEGDKLVLDASLKDIWGSQFETLSFADQKWATSEAYGKEAIARYQKEGIEKLADLWDVTHKLNKTASEPKLGPEGTYAKPSTGSSNKEHNVKNSPVTKPGQESAQKGPSAPAHADVKTDYKLDMPGQEKGQTGPAAPKAKEVKTDYSEPKPEAEGKEVKTTPKNPDEKDADKSAKEVKTDYVAAGTEAMEAEEKGEEKADKKATLNWASLTPKAQQFIKTAAKKYIESGMKNAEAVVKAHSEFTAQETIMEKKASDKPVESVDGTTIPDGKKSMGDKSEESVQGDTQPKGAAPTASPDMSVEKDDAKKTTDLTKAPEESVDGTTIPSGSKVEESVQKSAATEMPMPEEHKEEIKVEEKPMDLPMGDEHKEEVSAFDATEKLDIGDGYSARKDHESKEIIIEKDSKEVKRLPDGFGKDAAEVLKLMKAVLGLPAEEAKPAMSPDVMAPKMEEKKEEPMADEMHPALEEAHEDEMGIKESALKAKEAELLKKEAALKAKEDAVAKEEASKKFASILQARSERCRKIVAELVEKEQLSYDKAVYESELKNGAHLLDARKKAFEASISSKMKEFIALNDEGLSVMEATVKSLHAPVKATSKKASHLFVSPAYKAEMTDEEEIAKIFRTMGDSKQHPQ